jgi:hypothetical protein
MKRLLIIFAASILGMVACNDKVELKNEKVSMDGIKRENVDMGPGGWYIVRCDFRRNSGTIKADIPQKGMPCDCDYCVGICNCSWFGGAFAKNSIMVPDTITGTTTVYMLDYYNHGEPTNDFYIDNDVDVEAENWSQEIQSVKLLQGVYTMVDVEENLILPDTTVVSYHRVVVNSVFNY